MQNKLVWIIILTSFLGCSETEYPHKFPIVFTEPVTEINASGATFSGRIENLDGFSITGYGFVWDQTADPTLTESHVTISSNVKEGKFSQVIKNDLEEGKSYFVRAYIQTDKIVVYGDSKVFSSKGSLLPTIGGFTPAEGIEGTEIIITGKNFSTRTAGNIVTVGGVTFEVLSAKEDELVVKQPMTPLTGTFPFAVTVAGQTGTSSGLYRLIGPVIESLSKTTARVGDLITVNGKYFDMAEGMTMNFGTEYGSFTEPFRLSDTQLETYVPDYPGNTAKLRFYSLTPEYKEFEVEQPFTILDSWQRRSTAVMPERALGYASAQINNTVFVIGGRSLYEYNMSNHTWSKKQDFPGAYRHYGTAFSYDNKLYYGFGAGYQDPNAGTDWQYHNDLWSYNPGTNTWTSLGATPLSKRSRVAAVVIGNKAYIGFGSKVDPVVTQGDLWEYNLLAGTWSQINTSDIPGNFAVSPAAFAIGNKGYFVNVHDSDLPYTAVLWEFDPALSKWTRKSDLYDWMEGGPALTIGDHGLVICFMNGPTRVYEYDPSKDIWIRRQSTHAPVVPFRFGSYYQNKLHVGGDELWELSFE